MAKTLSILLQRIKKGDLKAFEEVYKAYYEKLGHFLLNYSQDQAKIEDVVQDTFITLWRKRKNINIQTSLNSYLYRMAYNKLMDVYRASERTDSFLNEYYHTAVLRAEKKKEDEESERKQKLRECLQTLPKRCKEVFTKSKFTGVSNQELADELEVSIKTIEKHITQGYKLLKKCMGVF